MSRQLLVSAALACAALVVGTAASARDEQRSVIPACETLLTRVEAQIALGEPHTYVLRRMVTGNTRWCAYAGGSKGPITHTASVQVGPYAEARKQYATLDKTEICPVSKAVCGKLTTTAKLQPNVKSFAGLEKALAQIGTVRQVRSVEYDNNPTFAWLPSKALAPLDEEAWVLVYVSQSAELLSTSCTDNGTTSPDLHCALKAAGFAYTAVS